MIDEQKRRGFTAEDTETGRGTGILARVIGVPFNHGQGCPCYVCPRGTGILARVIGVPYSWAGMPMLRFIPV